MNLNHLADIVPPEQTVTLYTANDVFAGVRLETGTGEDDYGEDREYLVVTLPGGVHAWVPQDTIRSVEISL